MAKEVITDKNGKDLLEKMGNVRTETGNFS